MRTFDAAGQYDPPFDLIHNNIDCQPHAYLHNLNSAREMSLNVPRPVSNHCDLGPQHQDFPMAIYNSPTLETAHELPGVPGTSAAMTSPPLFSKQSLAARCAEGINILGPSRMKQQHEVTLPSPPSATEVATENLMINHTTLNRDNESSVRSPGSFMNLDWTQNLLEDDVSFDEPVRMQQHFPSNDNHVLATTATHLDAHIECIAEPQDFDSLITPQLRGAAMDFDPYHGLLDDPVFNFDPKHDALGNDLIGDDLFDFSCGGAVGDPVREDALSSPITAVAATDCRDHVQ